MFTHAKLNILFFSWIYWGIRKSKFFLNMVEPIALTSIIELNCLQGGGESWSLDQIVHKFILSSRKPWGRSTKIYHKTHPKAKSTQFTPKIQNEGQT